MVMLIVISAAMVLYVVTSDSRDDNWVDVKGDSIRYALAVVAVSGGLIAILPYL